MRARWLVIALVASVVVLVVGWGPQAFDRDVCLPCPDTLAHLLGGVVLAFALRLTLPAHSWRDRLLLVLAAGYVFEVGQLDVAASLGALGAPGFGVGLKDIAADVLGAAIVEFSFRA